MTRGSDRERKLVRDEGAVRFRRKGKRAEDRLRIWRSEVSLSIRRFAKRKRKSVQPILSEPDVQISALGLDYM